jgi:hypothetical protein
MQMKQILAITFLIFMAITCFGQTSYPTHDSVHIFWQPNLKLTYYDYTGQPDSIILDMMQKYQFSASASVGIWSILDIPKKKKDRYKKFEKVYFAPAFERTTSFAKSNDTLQIEMQNLYLDICEIWARWARKELKTLQDTTNSTGTLSIFYMTVKQDMNDRRLAINKAYIKEVFIDKIEGAFIKWKTDISKQLDETKQWATTPEECYRLMTGKPIEEGYIKAPTVIGPMFNERK